MSQSIKSVFFLSVFDKRTGSEERWEIVDSWWINISSSVTVPEKCKGVPKQPLKGEIVLVLGILQAEKEES